jgi:hypothetical protein
MHKIHFNYYWTVPSGTVDVLSFDDPTTSQRCDSDYLQVAVIGDEFVDGACR